MNNQYSPRKVIGIWLAAVVPFTLLIAVIVPALSRATGASPVVLYWILLPANAAWLILLSLWIIRGEEGTLRWETVRRRIWLIGSQSDSGGKQDARYGFRITLGLVLSFIALILGLVLPAVVSTILYFVPFPAFTNLTEAGSPEFAGLWGWFLFAAAVWTANMLIAEELMFRGVLLPKMKGAFGRFDGIVNGILYGLYYLSVPLQIPFRWITGSVAALLAGRFRDNRMALMVRSIEGAAVMLFVLAGVTSPRLPPLTEAPVLPWLATGPTPCQTESVTKRTSIPAYIPYSGNIFQVNLQNADLSALDLSGSENDLSYACFNSQTVWPSAERLPPGFDPEKIMEWGKDPGVGLRELHDRGITGKGVGIAIIDQGLFTGHREYADRLMWHEQITPNPFNNNPTSFHASAVASIAAGKSTGVAPDADLYFFSSSDTFLRGVIWHLHYDAMGIRRVIELNRLLPANRKIRVISISIGSAPPGMAGSSDFISAMRDAEAAGIYMVFSDMTSSGRVRLAGRSILSDPDDPDSYDLSFLAQVYYVDSPEVLLIPVDSRTLAGPLGEEDYFFCRGGGLSWMMPFSAGLFALALQVDPNLTLDRFWELAFQTATPLQVIYDGTAFRIGKLVDPQALIAELPS